MLDAVRYFVVWQPMVLVALHFILQWTGVTNKQKMLHEHSQYLHELHMNQTRMNLTLTEGANASSSF